MKRFFLALWALLLMISCSKKEAELKNQPKELFDSWPYPGPSTTNSVKH